MSQQAIKNKVDIEAEFIDKTLEDSQSGHQMSRAGRLAMELAAEKRRLMTELEEVQAENDDLKSTTPIGTSDWYVKWVATGLSVFGIFAMSAGFTTIGQVAYVLSAVGWIFVGMQWSDRAIMIGSAITGTAVMMNLVTALSTAHLT